MSPAASQLAPRTKEQLNRLANASPCVSCEGRGRRCYGNPYSGTKPETVDTRQGETYGRDRLSPNGDREAERTLPSSGR